MSKEGLQAVIGRAVSDTKFREALYANPDAVLSGYDLTLDEASALKSVDAESMETLAGSLDERISKAFVLGYARGGGGGRKRTAPRRTRIGGPREGA